MAVQSQRATGGGFLPVLPPRFALVELAIFALIIAAEFWWEPFPDLTKLNPHPYWIAVLLLSLQYGTVSGLLAAALAIGGAVLVGLPESEIGESYFSYLVRVWTQPVLWVVVAMLLGSFRMRQIEEREYLQRQVDETTVRAAALTGYSDRLKTRVDTLERQLAAGQKPETVRLLDALGQLAAAAAHPAENRDALVHSIFDVALPGAQASLYVADAGGLRLVLAHRWATGARWRRELTRAEPLGQAVVTDGRALSIMAAADEGILAGEGVCAVPLFAPDGRTIAGMLKVEHMPASSIDADLRTRLAVIGRQIAPVLTLLGQATRVPMPATTEVAKAEGAKVAGSLRAFAVPLLRRIRNGVSVVGASEPEPNAMEARATGAAAATGVNGAPAVGAAGARTAVLTALGKPDVGI